jgi:hypothetical protein
MNFFKYVWLYFFPSKAAQLLPPPNVKLHTKEDIDISQIIEGVEIFESKFEHSLDVENFSMESKHKEILAYIHKQWEAKGIGSNEYIFFRLSEINKICGMVFLPQEFDVKFKEYFKRVFKYDLDDKLSGSSGGDYAFAFRKSVFDEIIIKSMRLKRKLKLQETYKENPESITTGAYR